MARKKSRSRSRRGLSSIGGFFRSGPVNKIALGLGSGALATIILSRVAPQFSGIGSVGAGFLGGGLIGGVANLFLTGGLSQLGGLLGSGQGNGGGESL